MMLHSAHFAAQLAEFFGHRSHAGGRPNLPEHSVAYCLLNKANCSGHVSPCGSLVWARQDEAERAKTDIATTMRIMASYLTPSLVA
jgi:hypothetical protein